jgi:hypothetical protein
MGCSPSLPSLPAARVPAEPEGRPVLVIAGKPTTAPRTPVCREERPALTRDPGMASRRRSGGPPDISRADPGRRRHRGKPHRHRLQPAHDPPRHDDAAPHHRDLPNRATRADQRCRGDDLFCLPIPDAGTVFAGRPRRTRRLRADRRRRRNPRRHRRGGFGRHPAPSTCGRSPALRRPSPSPLPTRQGAPRPLRRQSGACGVTIGGGSGGRAHPRQTPTLDDKNFSANRRLATVRRSAARARSLHGGPLWHTGWGN